MRLASDMARIVIKPNGRLGAAGVIEAAKSKFAINVAEWRDTFPYLPLF
jgi:hypothetical protein